MITVKLYHGGSSYYYSSSPFSPSPKQENFKEETTELIFFDFGIHISIPKYMQIQKFYLFIAFISFITQMYSVKKNSKILEKIHLYSYPKR